MALDDKFRDLQFDRTVTEPSVAFEPTPGQVRYLRVRAIEADGYRGPWGAVQLIDPPEDPTVWIVPALGILGILLL
jgi:hypothetical protein